MKLLLDQNLSANAAVILRSIGIDAVHAREAGLATAADDAILEWCRSEERIIVTLDADFHAPVLRRSYASASKVCVTKPWPRSSCASSR